MAEPVSTTIGAIIGSIVRAVVQFAVQTGTRVAVSSSIRAARRTALRYKRVKKKRRVKVKRKAVPAKGGKVPRRTPRDSDEPKGPVGRFLDAAWKIDSAINLSERLADKTTAALSTGFIHTIKVQVMGCPDADLRRLWYLCLAAGFGRLRNNIRPAWDKFVLVGTWVITEKTVALEIMYSGTTLFAAKAIGPSAYHSSPVAYAMYGPEATTIGGSWNTLWHIYKPAAYGLMAPPPNARQQVGTSGPIENFYDVSANVNAAVRTYVHTTYSGSKEGPMGGRLVDIARDLPVKILAGESPITADNRPEEAAFFRGVITYWGVICPPLIQPFAVGFNATATTLISARTSPRIIGDSSLEIIITSFIPFLVESYNRSGWVPALPDSGRVITSPERYHPLVQPPKPTIDGNLKSSVLRLVAQALHQPCFLPPTPPGTGNPRAASGIYVEKANVDRERTDTKAGFEAYANMLANAHAHSYRWPDPTLLPDGYRCPPTTPNFS